MAVPTQLSDLSATAASNSPAGGDAVGTTMDDYIRALASIIARIAAGTDKIAPAGVTGTAAILGANTFTGLQTANLGLTVAGADFASRGITDSATAKALTLSGSSANSVTIANSATNPTIGTSGGVLNLTSNSGAIYAVGATNQSIIIQSNTTGTSVLTLGNATNAARGQLSADNVGEVYVSSFATGGINFYTGGGTLLQVVISNTASAVRYLTLTGAIAGGNPKIATSAGSLDIGAAVVFTGQTVGTTVGAAGGASALPATPLGYITTAINGTACKIPYYSV